MQEISRFARNDIDRANVISTEGRDLKPPPVFEKVRFGVARLLHPNRVAFAAVQRTPVISAARFIAPGTTRGKRQCAIQEVDQTSYLGTSRARRFTTIRPTVVRWLASLNLNVCLVPNASALIIPLIGADAFCRIRETSIV